MKLTGGFGIVCATLVVASCAPTQAAVQELRLPPQRIVQKGYSLMPPDENGWFLGARTPHELALRRSPDSSDQSFVILATSAGHLPPFNTNEEYLQLVNDRRLSFPRGSIMGYPHPAAKDPHQQRFKLLRYEVSADLSPKTECALVHSTAEDTAAVRRSGERGLMILETLERICAHPNDKGVVVLVGYSDRYDPGREDPKFSERAMRLLRSVEFENL